METILERNQINIEDEMRRSYLDYVMSVIIGRALPDVRDGLKPVHRRVLWAMHELGNTHNKPYKKSARVVGDTIGKYHPHGDTAAYDTIVRLAQDFSMRYPLVDGQGNFGSIDGDSAAAMRYTEVRLQKLSSEVLADIEKETVDFQPNYDESLSEPKVLPTRFPNLLVNGSEGIAVGMATKIPPHNLTEILDATIELVRNPDISVEKLIKSFRDRIFRPADLSTGARKFTALIAKVAGFCKCARAPGLTASGAPNANAMLSSSPKFRIRLIKRGSSNASPSLSMKRNSTAFRNCATNRTAKGCASSSSLNATRFRRSF